MLLCLQAMLLCCKPGMLCASHEWSSQGSSRWRLAHFASFVNTGDKVLMLGATANHALKLMQQIAVKSLE